MVNVKVKDHDTAAAAPLGMPRGDGTGGQQAEAHGTFSLIHAKSIIEGSYSAPRNKRAPGQEQGG